MVQDSSSEKEPDDAEAEFVEVDPSGRYGRYKEILGKGAFKKVYRAFDELEGIEVAWNQVKVADLLKNSVDMERLYSEVHLLKTLKHKNIIKFYNSWVDAKTENINFITEIFTSGTLRQYRKKHKYVDLRALKKWSRQILEGLAYLHSHDPPVIHRDLKCDNIFVNGNQGEVKIGDLGLAAILQKAHSAHSVIGTPEFMAPELYEEEYNELIDIYAFGMCLLELVTFDYPYVECANAAQIYKKVTSGIRPASLEKVKDPEVRAFIEKCIAKVSDRVPASELLMDPFLHPDGINDSVGRTTRTNLYTTDKNSVNLDNGKNLGESVPESNRDFTVQGQRKDLNTIFLKLRIADSTGDIRNIHFPFDIEVDTSNGVASEMVEELDLTDQDVSAIVEMIDTEIRSYIPDWATKELSGDAGNEVAMSDSSITEGQVDSSPMTNESSRKSSLVLERLPSGRKYWSFSPKGADGSTPVTPGPSISLHENTGTSADSCTEESKHLSLCCQQVNGSSAEALLEKQEDLVGKKGDYSKHSPGTPDLKLGNGPNSVVGYEKVLCDFDSDKDNILAKKLEHVLVEHQRELDELKKKHELIVSDLLKELPPENRDKFVVEMSTHRMNGAVSMPESFLHICSRKLHEIAVEGGKQNSGAENLIFGPIFRDKFKILKMNKESDFSSIGIAVILRDNPVGV